jgi:hypothetical protein
MNTSVGNKRLYHVAARKMIRDNEGYHGRGTNWRGTGTNVNTERLCPDEKAATMSSLDWLERVPATFLEQFIGFDGFQDVGAHS